MSKIGIWNIIMKGDRLCGHCSMVTVGEWDGRPPVIPDKQKVFSNNRCMASYMAKLRQTRPIWVSSTSQVDSSVYRQWRSIIMSARVCRGLTAAAVIPNSLSHHIQTRLQWQLLAILSHFQLHRVPMNIPSNINTHHIYISVNFFVGQLVQPYSRVFLPAHHCCCMRFMYSCIFAKLQIEICVDVVDDIHTHSLFVLYSSPSLSNGVL